MDRPPCGPVPSVECILRSSQQPSTYGLSHSCQGNSNLKKAGYSKQEKVSESKFTRRIIFNASKPGIRAKKNKDRKDKIPLNPRSVIIKSRNKKHPAIANPKRKFQRYFKAALPAASRFQTSSANVGTVQIAAPPIGEDCQQPGSSGLDQLILKVVKNSNRKGITSVSLKLLLSNTYGIDIVANSWAIKKILDSRVAAREIQTTRGFYRISRRRRKNVKKVDQ